MNPIKLIGIGRSKYLYDTIKYLASEGLIFTAIITDKPNNEYEVSVKDFNELANNVGALFFQTNNLNQNEIKKLIRSNSIKIAISVNWKYKITSEFIHLFELGILNFHMGNLPNYKGNATPNWSIINGESHIFANVHKMVKEIDAGDVISKKSIEINNNTHVNDIITQSQALAPNLFKEAITKILNNPNYYLDKGSKKGLRCYPRLPIDSKINWSNSANEISRLVRASSKPFAGAYTYLDGKKIIIWKAKTIERFGEILAVPGHIIKVDCKRESIFVACSSSVLEVQEIESDGEIIVPSKIIKSIRKRFKS